MNRYSKANSHPGRRVIASGTLIVVFVLVAPVAKSWFGDQGRPHATPPRIAADPQVAERLVARMVDAEATREERFKAYAELVSMESGDVQQHAFLDALRRAPEDTAILAAVSMLCEDTPVSEEVDRIVEERLPTWSVGSQSQLLPPNFGCSQRKSATLRFIPRTILRDFLERGRERLKGLYGAVGTSAMLLARSSEPQDKELLASAVLVAPEVGGLWRGVIEQQAVGPAQRALARAIVQDPAYSFAPESQVKGATRRLIRVAAAAALSPDKAADEFAIAEIRAYLAEFSNGEMDYSRLPRVIEGAFGEKYDRYKHNLGLLANLMYLQTPAAKEVTFEYLDSADPMIRLTLAIVTARRWPERLLEVDPAVFTNEYGGSWFDILMAVLAFYHPELEGKALEKGSSQIILRTLNGLRQGGVWGLHGEAGVVVGGW